MKLLLLFLGLFSIASFGSNLDELFPNKQEKNRLFEKISAQAAISAKLKFCKKDWEGSYLNFMKALRAEKKWNQEQLAFIGAYHGGLMEMKSGKSEISSKPCQ